MIRLERQDVPGRPEQGQGTAFTQMEAEVGCNVPRDFRIRRDDKKRAGKAFPRFREAFRKSGSFDSKQARSVALERTLQPNSPGMEGQGIGNNVSSCIMERLLA
jgi:hypothetical protein